MIRKRHILAYLCQLSAITSYTIACYLRYQTDPETYRDTIQAVIDYNEDDCRATKLIKDWLKSQKNNL